MDCHQQKPKLEQHQNHNQHQQHQQQRTIQVQQLRPDNMTTASPTMTPPRTKAHRITPHHNSKSRYADQNRQRDHNHNDRRSSSGSISSSSISSSISSSSKRQQPNFNTNTNKRQHHQSSGGSGKKSHQSNKRQNSNPTPRKKSFTSESSNNSKNDNPDQLLDVTKDPQVAHKVRQRQKTLSKGKNTAGYARYRSLVPVNKRMAKSMTTPTTPNPYLDIPTKRWQGLVRAWRIALHQYDPPELVQTLQAPPVLSPDNDDPKQQDKKKARRESEFTSAAGCQTPSKDKSNSNEDNTSPGDVSMKSAMSCETTHSSAISIRNLSGTNGHEQVSPCVSVLSPDTPLESRLMDKNHSNKRDGPKKTEARRELDTLFAEAGGTDPKKTTKKKEEAAAASPPATTKKLTTGATGWGDEDSSDEEDDDLL